jgi:hypothetical protein
MSRPIQLRADELLIGDRVSTIHWSPTVAVNAVVTDLSPVDDWLRRVTFGQRGSYYIENDVKVTVLRKEAVPAVLEDEGGQLK